MASTMLTALATPFQAMSKAVPWSTEVRMNGIPRVTLTVRSKSSGLGGDVPLVVIEGEDGVVPPLAVEEEDRVGGNGP